VNGPWLGVDVGGERKGFDAALVGDSAVLELRSRQRVDDIVAWARAVRPEVIAVDSPRRAAPDGCTSRACERALARAVCGIRWTPDARRLAAGAYYGWVRAGLELYAALAGCEVIECFPTASWTRWIGPRAGVPRAAWTTRGLARLGLSGVRARNQDQRDAVAAAVTARQYAAGATEGFGEIHVPVGRDSVASGRGGPGVRGDGSPGRSGLGRAPARTSGIEGRVRFGHAVRPSRRA
jgi:predicted nuclease with RNAse H fold